MNRASDSRRSGPNSFTADWRHRDLMLLAYPLLVSISLRSLSEKVVKDRSSEVSCGGLCVKKPDGIGEACQCGDVTGDGAITERDVTMITKGTKKGSKVQITNLDRCHVGGTPACTAQDAKIIARYLEKSTKQKKGRKKKRKPIFLPALCDAARAH